MRKVTKFEDTNLDTIGKRITYLRTNAGMSQEELADKLNIKRQKLSYVETDTPNRQLSIDELLKLCDVFNVSSDYILGKSNAKDINNVNISQELGFDDETIERLKLYKLDVFTKYTLNYLLKDKNFVSLLVSYFMHSSLQNNLEKRKFPVGLAIKLNLLFTEKKYYYAEIIEYLPKLYLKFESDIENDSNLLYEYICENISSNQNFENSINDNDIGDEEMYEYSMERINAMSESLNLIKEYAIKHNFNHIDYLTKIQDDLEAEKQLDIKYYKAISKEVKDGNPRNSKKQEI